MRRLALAALALLAACSGPRQDMEAAPPAPPPPIAAYVTPAYRIQVGDILSIRLLLNQELNEDVTVRPDGHISTTVVADEKAADRTVPELIAALTKATRRCCASRMSR